MLEVVLVSIISSLGLGLCYFFGIVFIRSKKRQHILLGLLLMFLALRITKSVFYNFMELPLFVKNLGLAANLAVGPLLYLYGLSLTGSIQSFKFKYLFHFVPSLIYIFFSGVIPNAKDSAFWFYSYSFILLQALVYASLSLYVCMKHMNNYDKKIKAWYLHLIFALTGIWMVYMLIFIKVIPVYAAGPVTSSFLIFFLTYLAFNRHEIFSLNGIEKYRSSRLSFDQGSGYLVHLDAMIKEHKLYLNPNLNLGDLAEIMNLSTREVSQIINRHSHKNVASYINSYRIEEAKKLLKSESPESKIISIAHDSGFNNLSTFNVAFKAMTNQTPTEYRAKFR
ncbi:MAG: helix-turn-helix domain-containing protein [Bacteroidota bacterium]